MSAKRQVATLGTKIGALLLAGGALLLLRPDGASSGPASHDPWKLQQVRVGGTPVLDAPGRCEVCHTLDVDRGESGTSFIASSARTLNAMTLARGGGPWALADQFGCTFCHSNLLDNVTMDDVLSDFEATSIKHPIGRLIDGVTNTNNEYLSATATAPVATELQCNECHDTTILTYPHHEGRTAGDPAQWTGIWNKTNNPMALRNVAVAADAEKNHCVNTCHGDLSAPGPPDNGPTKPQMGHYTWGGYDGTNIYDASGQALQAGATATCTVCHDTHTSTKANLIQDGLDRGVPDPPRVAINETTCVAVCHAPGAFDTHGHGGKVGINSTTCMPCHSSAISHRDTSSAESARRLAMIYTAAGMSDLVSNRAADGFDNDMDGVLDNEASFAYSKYSICRVCHGSYAGHGSGTRAASCLDCHDVHGDDAVASNNAVMMRSSVFGETTVFTTADRGAGTFYRAGNTNAACDNAACHTAITTNLLTDHRGGAAALSQPCSDCHNMTHSDPLVLNTDGGFMVTRCTACHFAASDLDNWNITDATAATISSTEWTAAGHGRTTAYPSGNPGANFAGPAADASGCAYCHSISSSHGDALNPFRLANKGTVGPESDRWNRVCLVCHSAGDAGYDPDASGSGYTLVNGARNVDENHAGSKHGAATLGGAFCWDCHDPHGDTQHYMVHSGNGSAPGLGVSAVTEGTYGVPTASRPVEGFDVVTGGYTSADLIAAAPGTGGTYNGLCQTCHAAGGTGANYFYRNAAPPASAVHNSYDSTRCTTCHLHTNDFAPACADCHGDVTGMAVPRGDGSSYPPEGPVVARSGGSGGTVNWAETTGNSATVGHHQRHVANYGLGACTTCHTATPGTGATHLDNGTNATMTNIGGYGSWNAGAQPGATSVVDDTCTNMTCHDSTYSANAYMSAANPAYVRYWNSNLNCYSCHAYDGVAAAAPRPTADIIATGSHPGHIAAAGYALVCTECHPNNVGNNAHKDGAVSFTANFGATRLGASLGGAYDADGVAPFTPATPVPSGTTSQYYCANLYCHSTGEPRGIAPRVNAVAQWTVPGSADCGDCHAVDGVLGTMTTNVHAKHVGSAAGQYTFRCETCHSGIVSWGGASYTVTSFGQHVNNVNDVDLGTNEGTYATGVAPAGGDCTATYCHSRGLDWTATYVQGVNAPAIVPDWDSATGSLFCYGCHGDGASLAYPTYANDTVVNPGSGNQTKKNSHGAHGSYTCNYCHNATTTDGSNITTVANHANKAWNLAQGGGATFTVSVQGNMTANTYTATTCTDISCHGGAGTSAQWGATLACGDCHNRTTAGGGDLDNWSTDGTAARINSDEWAAAGHGRPTASGAYPGGNAAANFTGPAGTDPQGCQYCHTTGVAHGVGTNPFRLANLNALGNGLNAANGWGWNDVCLVCHSSADVDGYDPDGGAGGYGPRNGLDVNENHYGSKHANREGGQFCWDCHDPHGDAQHLMVQQAVTDAAADDYGTPATTRPVTGLDVVGGGGFNSDDLANAGNTGLCQTCHAASGGASYYTRTLFTALASHNGADSTLCTICHQHTADFSASCDNCHGGGTTGSVRNNYWPDGSTAAAENTAGAHLDHVTAMARRLYGQTPQQVLDDVQSDAKQKHLCKFCHGPDPGADADHGNPANLPADVPDNGMHPLWDSANSAVPPSIADDGDELGKGTTRTCATVDCHYNTTTAGWESGTAASCTTCHNRAGADTGVLLDAWVDLGTAATGDHYAHFTALSGILTDCSACHTGTTPADMTAVVTTTSHIDGDRLGDTSIPATYDDKSAGTPAYGATTADDTCTNVSCHGGQTTPPWQTGTIDTSTVVTAQCEMCHARVDGLTNPTGTEYNDARSGAHIDHDHGCDACHSAAPGAHYTGIGTIALDNPNNIGSVAYSVEYTDTTNVLNGATNGYFNDAGTAGGVSGTCATVTCHAGASPAWDVDLTATCNLCHLDTPTSNSHPAHVYGTPGTADHTDCDQCHPSATYAVAATGTDTNFIAPGLHADGTINLNGGIGASGSGGTTACATACHARETTTTWNNTTVPMTCNSCHYYAPAPTAAGNVGTAALGGTHNAHFFGAPANIVCTDCHADNTADVNDKRTHMDNTGANDGAVLQNKGAALQDEATITATALGPGGSDPDPGDPTCDNTLCHNPSPGAAYSATWGGTNTGCAFCHADTTGSPGSGSHDQHINYAAAYAPCTRCHVNNAVETHMNRQVSMANVTYGGVVTPPYTSATWGACTALACHDTAADPSWGQVQGTDITDCAVCHGDTNDADNFSGNNGTASEIATGAQWTTYGHGAQAGANQCTDCHDFTEPHDPSPTLSGGNPFRLGGYTDLETFCTNTSSCHTGAQSSAVVSHTAANMSLDQRTWPSWVPKCVDCHDPHGDGTNLAMMQGVLFDRGSSTHGIPTATLNGIPRTTDTLSFTVQGGIAAGSYAQTPGADGVCQECHLANDGVATGLLSFQDDNGTPLAGGHPTTGLDPCTSCHVHDKAFEPAACEICHGNPPHAGTGGGAGDDAPNVMGDGNLPQGDLLHSTPKPFDDGNYGYNVNGHGRDDDTSSVSHGNAIDVGCTACHNIQDPLNTHLDGVLNGRISPDTRNTNSFHLLPVFVGGLTSEASVETAFDNGCWNGIVGCHSGRTTDMRHLAAGDPLPNYPQLGTHNTFDVPASSPPPEMFYDANIRTMGAYDGVPNFAICVTCHDPHGTNVVSPRADGNNKMVIYRWASPSILCSRCHL